VKEEAKIKRYLVTGGAGFIGSNIVKYLLKAGHKVKVFDDFSTGKKENIQEFVDMDNFELYEGDSRNIKDIKEVIKGIGYVLHQAAIPSVQRSIEHPIKSNDSNIKGTLNLLLAARDEGVKKVVYASSSSIYGPSQNLPKREDMPVNPISPYALTKYTGEKYCQIFSDIYGLPTVCLRYFNVFGPKQDPNSEYSAVIPKFINLMLKGTRPIIFGDGEQSRDFTYVDNVVRANIKAAHSDIIGEVINIACGGRITINKIVEKINEILQSNIIPRYENPRQGDIRHSKADISKAKNLLSYSPIIDFINGLNKTVEWFKEKSN